KWFDASVFDIKPNINGFNNSVLVLSGVTWTIKWEWGFYFSLPIIYFLRSKPLEASIGIMFVCIFYHHLQMHHIGIILLSPVVSYLRSYHAEFHYQKKHLTSCC
ncbi:TPA: hypothetical protein ACHLAV_000001, partial [Escherichia coli]